MSRKAAGFFPALLPTQQTQQDDNTNFYSREHPKYERTILALLDSLDDGGMLLRKVAVYQSTLKTSENTHKIEPLRQHRSVSSSLIQISSGNVICTMQFFATDQLDAISLFITPLYMFRASQCSSSGDRIVLIHRLV